MVTTNRRSEMTAVSEIKAICEPQGNARHRVAIGYVRVAAELQSGSCLDAQAGQVRAIADAEGIQLVGVVGDSGKSAHNLNRPGLLTLLAAVAAGGGITGVRPELSAGGRHPPGRLRPASAFASSGL